MTFSGDFEEEVNNTSTGLSSGINKLTLREGQQSADRVRDSKVFVFTGDNTPSHKPRKNASSAPVTPSSPQPESSFVKVDIRTPPHSASGKLFKFKKSTLSESGEPIHFGFDESPVSPTQGRGIIIGSKHGAANEESSNSKRSPRAKTLFGPLETVSAPAKKSESAERNSFLNPRLTPSDSSLTSSTRLTPSSYTSSSHPPSGSSSSDGRVTPGATCSTSSSDAGLLAKSSSSSKQSDSGLGQMSSESPVPNIKGGVAHTPTFSPSSSVFSSRTSSDPRTPGSEVEIVGSRCKGNVGTSDAAVAVQKAKDSLPFAKLPLEDKSVLVLVIWVGSPHNFVVSFMVAVISLSVNFSSCPCDVLVLLFLFIIC